MEDPKEVAFRKAIVGRYIEIDWEGEWYLAVVRRFPVYTLVESGEDKGNGQVLPPSNGDDVDIGSFINHELVYATGEEEMMLLRSDHTALGGNSGKERVQHAYRSVSGFPSPTH